MDFLTKQVKQDQHNSNDCNQLTRMVDLVIALKRHHYAIARGEAMVRTAIVDVLVC